MENLSDTYHDPSQRVPKIYYWNADPPLKKIYILFRGGIYYCAANITGFYFVGNILMVIVV